MSDIFVNGSFLEQRITGVQRYAKEIISAFKEIGYNFSIKKNVWEQFVLPHQAKNSLIWSPCNIGPIFSENQVITCHDLAVFVNPSWFGTSYRIWKKTVLPPLLKRCRGIITVSKSSKAIITDYLNIEPKKIKVIYNGINHERFKPIGQSKISFVKEKHNIDKPYFIYVGSLDPRKNIEGLINSWGRTPAGVKENFDLIIVGGFRSNFRNNGNLKHDRSVRFLGYVQDKDLAALYSGAYTFLYPSHFEGFGLPVLEAMACGCPVITSANSSLKEICGNAAKLIDSKSIEELSHTITNFARFPEMRKKFIQLGFKRSAQFSWKKSAISTYQFLKQNL